MDPEPKTIPQMLKHTRVGDYIGLGYPGTTDVPLLVQLDHLRQDGSWEGTVINGGWSVLVTRDLVTSEDDRVDRAGIAKLTVLFAGDRNAQRVIRNVLYKDVMSLNYNEAMRLIGGWLRGEPIPVCDPDPEPEDQPSEDDGLPPF